MTENEALIPLWLLLMVSFGFMIGWALGDEVRRRKNAEDQVDDLRERLASACRALPAQDHQLKEMRGVLNDAHRLIHAVSKSLEKPPS
jgi:uncharacterized membrane protein YccC